MKASMLQKQQGLDERCEELSALLGDADTIANQEKFRAYAREFAEIEPIATAYRGYQRSLDDMQSS